MTESRSLRIHMLGRFEIMLGQSAAAGPARHTKLWLFMQYLILEKGRPVPHGELAGAIWPDSQNPISALRTMMHRFRRMAEENACPALADCIVTVRGAYAWNTASDCAVDIYEFERCVKNAEAAPLRERLRFCSEAAGLYAGELLPGVNKSWVQKSRYALKEQYIKNTLMMSGLLRSGGEYRNARELCLNAIDRAGEDERLSEELNLIGAMLSRRAGQDPERVYRLVHTVRRTAQRELENLLLPRGMQAMCGYESFLSALDLMKGAAQNGAAVCAAVVSAASEYDVSQETDTRLALAVSEVLARRGGLAARLDRGRLALLLPAAEEYAQETLAEIRSAFGGAAGKRSETLVCCLKRI